MLLSRCYYVVDAKGNLSQPYQEPWVQDLAIAQTVVMVVGMTGAIITLLTMMRASTWVIPPAYTASTVYTIGQVCYDSGQLHER